MRLLKASFAFVLILCLPVYNRGEDEKILHRYRRVINGRRMSKTDFPFLVSIRGNFWLKKFGFFPIPMVEQCGASLINDQWLLSAAHCFPRTVNGQKTSLHKPSKWTAHLASKRRSPGWRSWLKHIAGRIMGRKKWYMWKMDIQKILIHPQFTHEANDNGQLHYDIALLKLKERVPHEDYETMAPIRIPTSEMSRSKWPSKGTKCSFAGWGCRQNGGKVAEMATKVNFTVVDDYKCLATFGSRYVNLENDMCAGQFYKNRGICSGDSGGPLICEKNGVKYQAGIASATAASAPQDFPGIFTKVSRFRSWILNTIKYN